VKSRVTETDASQPPQSHGPPQTPFPAEWLMILPVSLGDTATLDK